MGNDGCPWLTQNHRSSGAITVGHTHACLHARRHTGTHPSLYNWPHTNIFPHPHLSPSPSIPFSFLHPCVFFHPPLSYFPLSFHIPFNPPSLHLLYLLSPNLPPPVPPFSSGKKHIRGRKREGKREKKDREREREMERARSK